MTKFVLCIAAVLALSACDYDYVLPIEETDDRPVRVVDLNTRALNVAMIDGRVVEAENQ